MSRDQVKRLPELRRAHAELQRQADAKEAEVRAFQEELYQLRAELAAVKAQTQRAYLDVTDADSARQAFLRQLPDHLVRGRNEAERRHQAAVNRLKRVKAQAERRQESAVFLAGRGQDEEADRERARAEALSRKVPEHEKQVEQAAEALAAATEKLDAAEAAALED